ncbi:MAG: amino acid adenylation domain-containing protein [bacterium]|nr:amino acid adenylation domain-containing protein [bacterium]
MTADSAPLGYTPSDFPLAIIRQQQLDGIFETFISRNIEVEDIYALAPSQQSMIFHHLYSPDSSVTVEQQVFVIGTALNINAFRQVWQTLLDRHAGFRASFHWQGLEEQVQVIHRGIEVPFEVLDWQHLSAGQRESRIFQFLEEDRRKGFDLSEAPLMRVFVIRLEESLYSVVWTHHHLLLDGWCRGILMREIARLYDAYARGQESALEPTPPFKRYIRWLKKQDPEKSEEFWRDYMNGFKAPILISKNLPYRNDPSETRPYGEIRHECSSNENRRLSALSKRHKITLNTLLQGAWALLLSHYSGEQDIVFGATVSGRPAELEGALDMIGCFMNTVPMRVSVDPSGAIGPWLQDIQLNHTRVRKFEYTSLAEIRSCSEVPRVSALYDLYETIVVFENYPFDFDEEAGQLGAATGGARLEEQMDYPLTLYIIPGAQLSFKLLFDSRFFNETVVQQLMAHLLHILEHIAGHEDNYLGQIPTVTPADSRLMTADWNDTNADYPEEKTIVQLFREQVAAAPDQTAVVFEDSHLTYRQLNGKANRLAWDLREKGICSNRFVALKVDRSLEMVIGILGILKAGGTYLPISPELPGERVEFMMKDSGTGIMLTKEELETPYRQSEENPGAVSGPGDLAYIMYTSGTTGQPKGVMVEHRHVVNLLTWFGRRYHLDTRRHVMQMSDYVFDPSVEQILGTLAFGSTVYMVPRGLLIDTDRFRRFVETRRIDMINFIPEALKELLLSHDTPIRGLKTVISGGDRLEESIKDGIIKMGYHLYNHYGPTEITVDALTSECTEEKVNLGKPIANTRVYVLDRQHRLLPVGVPGELCIAGDGVTRGYLNSPELTADAFVAFDKEQALYHTGDLVRWLAGGDIQFLGRVDQQVKIRGLRVEPGEIESYILAIKGINEAVVLMKKNEKGDKYLCAYFSAETPLETSKLKDHLINKIPLYMVPTGFVQLERLPLNPNGKVDIPALPEPELLSVEDYVAPADEVEEQLVRLWAEILGLEEIVVGTESNFFDLGGQSILAMKMVSGIREQFQVKLPLAAFFQVSTIKGIAALIRQDKIAGDKAGTSDDHSFSGVKFEKKKRRERQV